MSDRRCLVCQHGCDGRTPPAGTCSASNSQVCDACGSRLTRLLADMPRLMALIASRGDQDVSWAVRETLLVWTCEIVRRRHHRVPQTWGQIGRYLRQSTPYLMATNAQAVDELIDALSWAWQTIGDCGHRPPQRRTVESRKT